MTKRISGNLIDHVLIFNLMAIPIVLFFWLLDDDVTVQAPIFAYVGLTTLFLFFIFIRIKLFDKSYSSLKVSTDGKDLYLDNKKIQLSAIKSISLVEISTPRYHFIYLDFRVEKLFG